MVTIQIRSKKHKGAVFIRQRNSKDNFICKFYPGQERFAQAFQDALLVVEPLEVKQMDKEQLNFAMDMCEDKYAAAKSDKEIEHWARVHTEIHTEIRRRYETD